MSRTYRTHHHYILTHLPTHGTHYLHLHLLHALPNTSSPISGAPSARLGPSISTTLCTTDAIGLGCTISILRHQTFGDVALTVPSVVVLAPAILLIERRRKRDGDGMLTVEER